MLLIDCYNLLHTPMPAPLAGLDEARLLALLAAGRWRQARVVCDGMEKPHAPAGLGSGGIELLYSGPGRAADDVIMALIDADTAPRRLTVVSNDREIQKAARRRRARAMTCEAFIGDLARIAARRPPSPAGDSAKPAIGDADYWLKQFGFDPDQEPRKK